MGNNKSSLLTRNMKALRESRGYTEEQVCFALNIRLASLLVWENSRSGIPLHSCARLCEFYGYTDIYRMLTEEIRFAYKPVVSERTAIKSIVYQVNNEKCG